MLQFIELFLEPPESIKNPTKKKTYEKSPLVFKLDFSSNLLCSNSSRLYQSFSSISQINQIYSIGQNLENKIC